MTEKPWTIDRILLAPKNAIAEIEKLRAEMERLKKATPIVAAYSGSKEKPIDEWLEGWLDTCDYHQSLVFKATIDFIRQRRTELEKHNG